MNKGLIIVVSAPSGGGKGTILGEYFKRHPETKFSISATTRSPRPGEVDGVNYYYITKEKFREMIDNGKMLEYAEYVGNYYGTPLEPVELSAKEGNDIILEIEVKGGAQVMKKIPDCVSIFITPPSMEVLRNRLIGRGTESMDVINERLETAGKELTHASEYDYIVVNDELENAVRDLENIIHAEKLKYKNNHNVQIFKDIED
ncbi:MAG: guanylate kinase [Clostridia bacterium]|nr:guanylate kinase [Clostridia bacterium]